MSFWEKTLGSIATPAAPAPRPQTTPWFQQVTPTTPQPYVQPQMAPVVPQPQAPLKAQSARSTDTCPDCGSGNIFKPVGMQNAMQQCYHCGWNPRFAHSTAGAGMPSDGGSGPATPSRQVSKGNNFNPQTIVGHVG